MRDPYWDIIKGLGIIAVVMGHVDILAMEVNWFHLELFFFVSGFLFNAEKCLDYGQFFLRKIKTLWKPFVLYNAAFFVLHDFFIYIGWIALQPVPEIYYFTMVDNWIGIYELPRHISNVMFAREIEIMCGATWFMLPFFSNILIFAILVKFTYNKPVWQLPVLLTLFFALGVEIVERLPGMVLYGDMALFLLPIIAAGFYLRKLCFKKNLKASDLIFSVGGVILLICSIGVLGFLEYRQSIIALSDYRMGDWKMFLVAAFSGIYLIMFLARIILLSDFLKKVFAYIGEKSFHIMALHFVGFKILMSLYVIVKGLDYHLVGIAIPFTPISWQGLYVVFGVCVPLILCKIYSVINARKVL